ncbi:WD repeat-containing protein slp1 [Polyrhizophydium stewartii]|uniref:WD repeat-containing protein slp1 n=1 Tax=Polyrhizophydium stewartii TaxID=2732419 RepID=A0ABR4N1T6_9FUNG|nr:ubiquitin-protein transferase activating protein [Polyrhizophydium stewartii]
MESATATFSRIKEPVEKPKPLDADELAYQAKMAQACGVAIDQRILAFNVEPPTIERHDLRTTWSRMHRPNTKIARRRIPTVPEKVLDAPGLVDDFYLNLLDWSSRNILAIALDRTVYIWNADTGSVQEFCSTAEDDLVTSLQWTLDGSYLAVGTANGDAQIWDVDSASKVRTMRGRNSRVGVLSWDRHIVSSGARDGSIWHHDVRVANHKVAELLGHSSEICGLKWRPDGQMLASGGNDNLVNIWDVRSTTPRFTKSEHMAAVKAIAWCPWQLNLLATGGGTADRTVHFWNTTTAGKVTSVNTGSQVTSIVWSREYKEFLTSHGFPDNQLAIWSYPSLRKVADLPGHDSRVLHTALSPDGQTVASTASDENLKFWKVFESRKAKGALAGAGATGISADDLADGPLAKSYARMTIR